MTTSNHIFNPFSLFIYLIVQYLWERIEWRLADWKLVYRNSMRKLGREISRRWADLIQLKNFSMQLATAPNKNWRNRNWQKKHLADRGDAGATYSSGFEKKIPRRKFWTLCLTVRNVCEHGGKTTRYATRRLGSRAELNRTARISCISLSLAPPLFSPSLPLTPGRRDASPRKIMAINPEVTSTWTVRRYAKLAPLITKPARNYARRATPD